MFNLFRKQPQVKGTIGYLGLADWWLSTFSENERKHIIEVFNPLGGDGKGLIEGDISWTSESAVSLFSALSGWFRKEEDRSIAYRMLEKGEQMITSEIPILDIHFFYHSKVETFYRFRKIDSFAFDKSVEACRQQIAIAPKAKIAFEEEYSDSPLPTHTGYEQLAIILEKQEKYQEVIDLCSIALEQGWWCDGEKRISRCLKKMENSKRT